MGQKAGGHDAGNSVMDAGNGFTGLDAGSGAGNACREALLPATNSGEPVE
jgi:hypothetical protein